MTKEEFIQRYVIARASAGDMRRISSDIILAEHAAEDLEKKGYSFDDTSHSTRLWQIHEQLDAIRGCLIYRP